MTKLIRKTFNRKGKRTLKCFFFTRDIFIKTSSGEQFHDEFKIGEEIKERSESEGSIVVSDKLLEHNEFQFDPNFTRGTQEEDIDFYHLSQSLSLLLKKQRVLTEI